MKRVGQQQPSNSSAGSSGPEAVVLQRACACGQRTTSGGVCEACSQKQETALQRSAIDPSSPERSSPSMREGLSSTGHPLDADTRSLMDERFGHDFSRVRVHTDAKAAKSASEVDAVAYTSGNDIVFGHDQYQPRTGPGKMLIAHELAHVIQQSKGTPGTNTE